MPRIALASALAALALSLGGCITINAIGGDREPLVETRIQGESGPKIVLVDIDGLITSVDQEGPLGMPGPESTVARLREQLDRAREDDDVGALLLRVNSPGGAVTAADVAYQELVRFKEDRDVPIAAQLMGVAASGGYYVALASDVILAHPTSITGSIGVISAGINVSGLMARYDVEDQTFTSGRFKDAGSPLRPMAPEERAYLQGLIDDLHHRFEEVVDKGRPAIEAGEVRRLADGRAFTATQAAELGLVDGVGYIHQAIDELERRMGVEESQVVTYHRRREWRANIYSTAPRIPRTGGDLRELLALERGPAFFYLWWPAAFPR